MRWSSSLGRRKRQREPYDVVLIVCEGGKTEPHYFNGLRNKLCLSHANIRVCGKECGSSPISVVEYAEQEFSKNRDYDRVFCVFDKDTHTTYSAALDKIKGKQKKKKNLFNAVTSVPCFEFWLLLHYEDTTRPYGGMVGSYSACDKVISDLRKHIHDYEKGREDIFEITYQYISKAVDRACSVEKRQKEALTDNPSTKIHHLIKYLESLKQR